MVGWDSEGPTGGGRMVVPFLCQPVGGVVNWLPTNAPDRLGLDTVLQRPFYVGGSEPAPFSAAPH